ncbi:MAG TPA: PDZ domain-containing protein [Rhodanobacteraceae bacterium]|nr:PDZ domain-containing protein [Rhodanobacteraceae bacterium]
MPSPYRASTTAAPPGHRHALRIIVIGSLILLGGCVGGSRAVREEPVPATPTGRFEPLPGRGPEFVAGLRAGPPPAQPQLVDGKNRTADRDSLAARGYVPIGDAHFDAGNTGVRQDAIAEGVAAGADKVLLYPPEEAPGGNVAAPVSNTPDDTVPATWLAVYYVRLKPPFGATFRDLSSAEQQKLHAHGGVRIGSIIGGTPASEANLLSGDVVLELDGQPIANKADFEALLKARLGKRVTLSIRRDGRSMQRMVRLGSLAPLPSRDP